MYRCVAAAAGFQFYSAQNRQQRISSELKEVTALRREEGGDNGIKILDRSLIGFNYSNKTFATDPLLYCRVTYFISKNRRFADHCIVVTSSFVLLPHLKGLLFTYLQHVSLPFSDQTVYI